MSDASITQLVTLAVTIIGFLVTIYRENRARAWANEDRARIAEELRLETLKTADDLRKATEAQAAAVAKHLREESMRNLQATAQATQHARDAFTEANRVNEKIAATNQQLVALGQQIKVGSDHAEHAFVEANHVNQKIENLNQALVKQGQKTEAVQQQSDERLESIEMTGEDSNQILKEKLVATQKDGTSK